MRAKTVNYFERGLDPREAMGTGDPKAQKLTAAKKEWFDTIQRNKTLKIDEKLKRPYAICFEPNVDFNENINYFKSKYEIKSVYEFFNDKDLLIKIEEAITDLAHNDYDVKKYTETYRSPAQSGTWRQGKIKSARKLLDFFIYAEENETYRPYYGGGFDALEADFYLEKLEEDLYPQEEEK